MSPDGVATPAPKSPQIVRRFATTWLKPRWPEMALAGLCAVLVAGLSAVLVWLLDPALKYVIGAHRQDAMLALPLAIVVIGVMRAGAQIAQATLVNRIGHSIVGKIQLALFGSLIRADLARLRQAHSGSYLSSVLYDATLVREGLTNGVINYTQNFLTVLAMFVVMGREDWVLTLIVLATVPVAALTMRNFSKRTRKAASGAMNETAALSTAVLESLDGIKVIKIDGREVFEDARVREVVERRQKHIIKGANARAGAAPAVEALGAAMIAAVIAYSGLRGLGFNQIATYLTAFLAMNQSLRQLANLQTVITEGTAALGRLLQALDIQPEIADVPDAKALVVKDAEIAFEAVSFAYAPDAPALAEVSLSVRRGETIALVGPSGGGKSTALNLIPRFFDSTGGSIAIDGQDVRGVTLESLRKNIALVTQEPFLFDDTLVANIAYARPDATREEIEDAARAAAAHDFILDLPNGYDTAVGEAGARLSGGQKQRIAIARAFLKNAPILLLDEATSALDAESEIKVQEALERLMAGRTTILIAHRLATVRKADCIYVIDRGRVVEAGAHEALVRQDGLYARMARAQNLDSVPGALGL